MHHPGADVPVAVGGDGDTDAGAADQYPAPRLALLKDEGQPVGEVPVSDRAPGIYPEIERIISKGRQLVFQQALELEAGMIAGNDDDFLGFRHRDPSRLREAAYNISRPPPRQPQSIDKQKARALLP